MITRALLQETLQTAKEFKVVCITGPRQSGKTTLCRQAFPGYRYISLEDADMAEQAMNNTRKFLLQFKRGVILDEVQRVPQVFNYLQRIVDEKKVYGKYILTGSNNFLMQNNISQSLSGRAGYIELLPFSLNELRNSKAGKRSIEQNILKGFYPPVVTGKATPERWLPNYIKTYIERDVRMLRNVGNLALFNKFIKLCAGRAAQIININALAIDTGVDNKTMQAWLSVLEGSYIIYFLRPHHENFNKQVIKSPKLYFYDTGLLCSLLGITSEAALKKSNHYGALFENFIVTEIRKNRLNKEQAGEMSFFRDNSGNEVDLILEKNETLLPIEIKSSKKPDRGAIKGLQWWQKVFRQSGGALIYGGNDERSYDNQIEQLSWKSVADV